MDKQAGLLGDIADWVGEKLGLTPEKPEEKPAPAITAPTPAQPAATPTPTPTPAPAAQPAPKPQPPALQPAQAKLKAEFKNYFKSKKPFGIILTGEDDASFNVAMNRLESALSAVYKPAANILWDGKNIGTSVADVDAAVTLIGQIKQKGLQARTAQLESLAQGAYMADNPVPKEGEEPDGTPLPVRFTIPAGAANQPQHPYNPQQTGALQNLLPAQEEPSEEVKEKLSEEPEAEPETSVDERIVDLVKLISKEK